MKSNHPTWPPLYRIKKHPLARHVRLKVSCLYGLEFIVPLRFNIKNIPALIEKNRTWIENQLTRIAIEQNELQSDNSLPSDIHLPAINQTWNINYTYSDTPNLITTTTEIQLMGNISDKIHCKKILISWIKNQAKTYLPQQLKTLSQELELNYQKVAIRQQSSRWGSCSAKKSINLNYKLIFLPAALVKHIMIHELCHTIHFNHSTDFWNLVAKYDPHWRTHRSMVRSNSHQFLPKWFLQYDIGI